MDFCQHFTIPSIPSEVPRPWREMQSRWNSSLTSFTVVKRQPWSMFFTLGKSVTLTLSIVDWRFNSDVMRWNDILQNGRTSCLSEIKSLQKYFHSVLYRIMDRPNSWWIKPFSFIITLSLLMYVLYSIFSMIYIYFSQRHFSLILSMGDININWVKGVDKLYISSQSPFHQTDVFAPTDRSIALLLRTLAASHSIARSLLSSSSSEKDLSIAVSNT